MTAACTKYRGKEIQPRKPPTRFSNKRFAGANRATPAIKQTGAATYFRCDHVSGKKVRTNPTAHSDAPTRLPDFKHSFCRKRSAMRIPAINREKKGSQTARTTNITPSIQVRARQDREIASIANTIN